MLIAILVGGCNQDAAVRDITERRVVDGAPLRLGAHSPARFGYSSPKKKLLDWECPPTWTEITATGLRLVNLRVPGGVQCFLSVLPGAAGGMLMNLNRWRGQLKVEDFTEADVARLPRLPMLGDQAIRMDVTGRDNGKPCKLLGLVLVAEDSTVFVKMLGPPSAVEAEERHFIQFIDSVRRSGEEHPLHWHVPTAWRTGAARRMRLVTIIPPDDDGIECYVTILNGTGGGTLLNINRWRQQIGMPATTQDAVAALPKRRVLGRRATLVELQSNPGDRGVTALLGIICQLSGRCVFVKMVGQPKAMQAARAGFFEFTDSLRE